MKKQTGRILILCTVILLCMCAFVGCGYLYLELDSRLRTQSADTRPSAVPYSTVPESAVIRFFLSEHTHMLLQLDFKGGRLSAELSPEPNAPADYTLQPDSGALAGFIDRLGGVELTQEGRVLRYTGSQAVKLAAENAVETADILQAVFDKIAGQGVTRAQLTYLLENSQTDLTVPICFSWPEWLRQLCANAEIIE